MQIIDALGVSRMQRLAEKGYWFQGAWDEGCPSPRDPDQVEFSWRIIATC